MSHKKLNEKGQTLEEFLAEYDPSRYRHPSVTADCVIFSGQKVLLVRRGNHPFIGDLAFPGGFVEYGESTEECAVRELYEETHATVENMRQFYTASTPHRDPRDWTVSVCYTAEVPEPFEVKGGDDAAIAAWYGYEVDIDGEDTLLWVGGAKTVLKVVRDRFGKVDINRTEVLKGGLAFDHVKILLRAIEERTQGERAERN